MTEKQFITLLKKNLKELAETDKKEILNDYIEHFRIGKEAGKGEDEISDSLGNPEEIGKNSCMELLSDQKIIDSSAGIFFKVTVASLSLLFFNLVFILGPYLGLVGIMIGLWVTAVSVMLSGIITSLAVLFSPVLSIFIPYMSNSRDFVLNLTIFIAGIALFSIGALTAIGMLNLTKLFYRGSVKYLQSNLRIICRS